MKRISFSVLKDRILKGALLALTAAAVMAFGTQAEAQTRIRDLVTVSGVRSNPVYGYGIVIGLDGTGDQTSQTPFTVQSIQAMLQQKGVNLPPGTQLQLKAAGSTQLLVDPEELRRFHRTYRGIPELPPEWNGRMTPVLVRPAGR